MCDSVVLIRQDLLTADGLSGVSRNALPFKESSGAHSAPALISGAMDPSIIGYCTMEDGTAVPYLLREGLPAWSREAQELSNSDRMQGQSSAAAGTEPLQEGGAGGSPAGSASPSDSRASTHAEQSVGVGGDGAPPPTALRAGEETEW